MGSDSEISKSDNWFHGGQMVEDIKPAEDVRQDSQQFVREQLPRLGRRVRRELSAILRHKQRGAGSELKSDEDFFISLNSLPLGQLQDYVESELKEVENADKALSQKRSRGFHRRVHKFQGYVVEFSQFLTAYSGIVNIVQSADAQYSNVASAAISLLFATLKIKAETEEFIHVCMVHITDRMPDLKVYEHIYPDPKLQKMIAEAYRDIIVFSRKVVVYYQDRGIVRYMRHLTGVSEIQTMEQNMRGNLKRISTKCEVLMAERIHDLAQSTDRLMKENLLLHARKDETQLGDIKKLLNLDNYPTKELRLQELKKHKESLISQFGGDRRRPSINSRQFLDTEHGKCWEGPGSMLLLLYGRNAISSSSPDSWLAPIAAELVALYVQSDVAAAYERCNRSSRLAVTLSGLILQLLSERPALLRQPQDFREVETQITRTGDQSERVEALRRALLRIINLHEGRVYIILNRPELCEAEQGTGESDESCTQYISTMFSLAKESTAELKIMMLLRSEFWDLNRNIRSFNLKGSDSRLFRPVQLDQGSN